MLFRLRKNPQTGFRQLSISNILVRAPEGANANQPEKLAPRQLIRHRLLRRGGRYAANLPRLCSVGVFVIVVGNYFAAAFYEASGASTCNSGFQHPRRNQCAPMTWRFGRAESVPAFFVEILVRVLLEVVNIFFYGFDHSSAEAGRVAHPSIKCLVMKSLTAGQDAPALFGTQIYRITKLMAKHTATIHMMGLTSLARPVRAFRTT